MLKPITLFAFTLLFVSSCKKSTDNPNPPTPPAPPAKDTSYLRKTETNYTLDASGNKTADSSLYKWAYDSKGRITSYISNTHFGGVNIDTSLTSYGTNQSTEDYVEYYGGVAAPSHGHTVQFFNDKGLGDSAISTGVSANVINTVLDLTPFADTTVTVYFYDANGNDTLDVSYEIVNGKRVIGTNNQNHKTYSGNMLQKMDVYDPKGTKLYHYEYSAGNILSVTSYVFSPDGSAQFTYAYTYSSVLSGGFYGYQENANLLATVTLTNFVTPSQNNTEMFSYTFDDANRVSTVTIKNSNTTDVNKEIYTYY